MIDKYDNETIYCRLLGHHLEFKYCRKMANGKPCNKIVNCTFETLDIITFLHDNYSQQEISVILQPSVPKLNSILKIIENVKKNN